MESTRIKIGSTLRAEHQAHPDRQEWVLMVECICAEGTILSSFGIFKGKSVLQNWIPNQVLKKWFFSTNTKGWTSNLYGLEGLKRVLNLRRVRKPMASTVFLCEMATTPISVEAL